MFISSKKGENTIMPSNAHGEKEKRKSRMDQSVSDGEKGKELKEKDSKRKKEKKEEKPMEEKYCKPGKFKAIIFAILYVHLCFIAIKIQNVAMARHS